MIRRLFNIELDGNDLGQLLDGLKVRADAWEKTSEFLLTGHSHDDSFICEECSNAHEAETIARHYRRIIQQIEQQMNTQGDRH